MQWSSPSLRWPAFTARGNTICIVENQAEDELEAGLCGGLLRWQGGSYNDRIKYSGLISNVGIQELSETAVRKLFWARHNYTCQREVCDKASYDAQDCTSPPYPPQSLLYPAIPFYRFPCRHLVPCNTQRVCAESIFGIATLTQRVRVGIWYILGS